VLRIVPHIRKPIHLKPRLLVKPNTWNRVTDKPKAKQDMARRTEERKSLLRLSQYYRLPGGRTSTWQAHELLSEGERDVTANIQTTSSHLLESPVLRSLEDTPDAEMTRILDLLRRGVPEIFSDQHVPLD
jgi:hypothetical protein